MNLAFEFEPNCVFIWKLKAIDRPNAQLKPLCREAAIEMFAALTPNRELAHCGCRRGQGCFGLCAFYGPGMGEGHYRPGRVDKQNVVKWLFAVNAGTISIKNVNGSCGKTATEMRGMAVFGWRIIIVH